MLPSVTEICPNVDRVGEHRPGCAENRPRDAELVQRHDDPRDRRCRRNHSLLVLASSGPACWVITRNRVISLPREQQAQDRRQDVGARVQRQAHVGAVEHRAAEHLRQRHVADDVRDHGD